MSVRIHRGGRSAFDSAFDQPMRPHRRQHIHGPIQPMERVGPRLSTGGQLRLLLIGLAFVLLIGALL